MILADQKKNISDKTTNIQITDANIEGKARSWKKKVDRAFDENVCLPNTPMDGLSKKISAQDFCIQPT